MVTIELMTPVGRLTLRRVIEEAYQHLYPLVAAGFAVKRALLDANGNVRVQVDRPVATAWGPDRFDVVLPQAELTGLDECEFMAYLTRKFLEAVPEQLRAHCSELLDEYAVPLGMPTKAELLKRPPAVEAV